MAHDDQRSLALLNEMEMNSVCSDRAMRNAAGRLRVAWTRSAHSAKGYRAKAANKFASPHRCFPRLGSPNTLLTIRMGRFRQRRQRIASWQRLTGKSLRFIGIGFALSQALRRKIFIFRFSERRD
jgi:hypothetical protein